MAERERNMGMPSVEFEGPLGMFWSMEEVPFEAMTQGIAEIVQELLRRGYKEDVILQAIKSHGELLKVAQYSKYIGMTNPLECWAPHDL